jgi:molybdopterin biosynthesis enzyme
LGIVTDEVDRIATRVEHALEVSDLLLTLGGTSLGEKDLVEQALRRVSRSSRIIHGIMMDRGRVAGIAEVRGKPLVMLPGPVQAATNAFLLLGIPLIYRLAGRNESALPVLTARLREGWTARRKFANFTKVLYVRLARKGGEFVAQPLVRETESMTILTDSDGFVVVPEQTVELRAGARVSVRLLPGFSYVAGRFLTGG